MSPTSPIMAFVTTLLVAASTPACVALFDPLAPFEEDAGGGDAGAADASDDSPSYAECDADAAVAVACGNCGTMTVSCFLGAWAYGPCLGEGVCTWGDEATCGDAGLEVRACQADCTWGSCSPAPAP